jgi:hypothetical protein
MKISELEKAKFRRDNPGYRAAVAIFKTCNFCGKTHKVDWGHRDANCCTRCADVAKLKAECVADKLKMDQIELIRMAMRG